MKKEYSERVTMYIPDRVMREFRSHCISKGLIMSTTIGKLVEEYLKRGKPNA